MIFFNGKNKWKKSYPPKWFDEYKIRSRFGYPDEFIFKGKRYMYKGKKIREEEQGNTLLDIYKFYKKRRNKK